MRRLVKLVATGSVLIFIGAVPAAYAQQPVVVRDATQSWQVSAYAAIVAWSDEVHGRYRLRYIRDGKLEQPAIAGRSVGFDADVGPDANGAPVIVYSRCRREPAVTLIGGQGDWQTARGCDLYRYSLATRRETKLHHVSSVRSSETTPSIWRGRIAFSSVSEARGGHSRVPRVVVAGL